MTYHRESQGSIDKELAELPAEVPAEQRIKQLKDELVELNNEIRQLDDELVELHNEIRFLLDSMPIDRVVRVREGNGTENLAASLAVSVINLCIKR